MRRNAKPILVTGSHRSGTTWAGQMLAAAPYAAYIHEPFNINARLGVTRAPFDHWFQYVSAETAELHRDMIDRVLRFDYPLLTNIGGIRQVEDVGRVARDQAAAWLRKLKGSTPIVKDPIAFFSAEWLCDEFDMNVLVMIRHPAAFCSSVKLKKWEFDFHNFADQPALVARYLSDFEPQIREHARERKNLIDQAILLWNCIHRTVATYQHARPGWIYARHEDLSNDPPQRFRAIYERFGLEFTERSRQAIVHDSGEHNPTEQQAGNEFLRNSKESIHNWKHRLDAEEIRRIRAGTEAVAADFYGDADWA